MLKMSINDPVSIQSTASTSIRGLESYMKYLPITIRIYILVHYRNHIWRSYPNDSMREQRSSGPGDEYSRKKKSEEKQHGGEWWRGRTLRNKKFLLHWKLPILCKWSSEVARKPCNILFSLGHSVARVKSVTTRWQ